MKKIIYFIFAIIAFTCCTKEDIKEEFQQYVDAKIFINTPVSVSSINLTKGISSNIYYAIEVDSLHISCSDTSYVHFAEGVFTNCNNLIVKLEKNRKYRFRATIIEDGNDAVYVNNNYVYNPFTSSSSKKTKITNEFIYGTSSDLELYNNCNTIKVNNNEDKWNAEVNRYYAESIDKEYRTKNSSVSLNTNRRNFGLRFNITPPTDGQIHVYQNYGYPKYDYVVAKNDNGISEDRIFALDLINEYQTIYLKVEWIKGNEVIDYSPASFKAYNETMTVINVDLVPKTTDNSVNLTLTSSFSENQINIY